MHSEHHGEMTVNVKARKFSSQGNTNDFQEHSVCFSESPRPLHLGRRMETGIRLVPADRQFITITDWLIVEHRQRNAQIFNFHVSKDRIPSLYTILPVNGDKAMFIFCKQKIAEPKTSCSARKQEAL